MVSEFGSQHPTQEGAVAIAPWRKQAAADGEIEAMEPVLDGLPAALVKPEGGADAKVTAARDSIASLDSATLQINADSRTNSGAADSPRGATSDGDENDSSPADSAQTGDSAGTAGAARAAIVAGKKPRVAALASAKGKDRSGSAKRDGAANGKPTAAASSAAGGRGLLSSLMCCAGGGGAGRGAVRDDSPDRAAERIRASTAPEEQRKRAAAAAKAALPAGRANGLQNGHSTAGGDSSSQRRQKDPDRGSPTRGELVKAGSSQGQPRRDRSKGRAGAAAAGAESGKADGSRTSRSRGDAAVVEISGSRVPDVVVDRQTRTSNRCADAADDACDVF